MACSSDSIKNNSTLVNPFSPLPENQILQLERRHRPQKRAARDDPEERSPGESNRTLALLISELGTDRLLSQDTHIGQTLYNIPTPRTRENCPRGRKSGEDRRYEATGTRSPGTVRHVQEATTEDMQEHPGQSK